MSRPQIRRLVWREIEYLTDPELAEPLAKPAVIHAKARAAVAAAGQMARLFTR